MILSPHDSVLVRAASNTHDTPAIKHKICPGRIFVGNDQATAPLSNAFDGARNSRPFPSVRTPHKAAGGCRTPKPDGTTTALESRNPSWRRLRKGYGVPRCCGPPQLWKSRVNGKHGADERSKAGWHPARHAISRSRPCERRCDPNPKGVHSASQPAKHPGFHEVSTRHQREAHILNLLLLNPLRQNRALRLPLRRRISTKPRAAPRIPPQARHSGPVTEPDAAGRRILQRL